jgi:cytochrome b involved in lipid metabolism
MQEEFNFVYKGVEYDASDYANKHPGGVGILRNMKHVKKDFTEYFRYFRSPSELCIPTKLKRS